MYLLYFGQNLESKKKVVGILAHADSLVERRPYNTFDAKIDPRLRYSSKEDEKGHPCAFGAGAPVPIGEGLPAPAAPPWIRP